VRDDAGRYADKGIVVFGIAPGSLHSHERFASNHHLTAPLLVDAGLRVAAQYDAVASLGPLKFVKRTVVGIDLAGRIVFYRRGMPSTDEILAGLGEDGHEAGRSSAD
jgi:peroxiredoxin